MKTEATRAITNGGTENSSELVEVPFTVTTTGRDTESPETALISIICGPLPTEGELNRGTPAWDVIRRWRRV